MVKRIQTSKYTISVGHGSDDKEQCNKCKKLMPVHDTVSTMDNERVCGTCLARGFSSPNILPTKQYKRISKEEF